MLFLIILLIIPFIIAAVGGYFVSIFTFKKLANDNNKWAKLISVITFIIAFFLILTGIGALILYNVHFER